LCNYTVSAVSLLSGTTAIEGFPNLYVTTDTTNRLGVDEIRPRREISVYPNPAYSECTISYNGSLYNKANVAIYDISGRRMLTHPLTGVNTTISIASLPPGLYLCRIDVDGTGVVSKKLVVMR
jgi:type IX secretion system substrate protein